MDKNTIKEILNFSVKEDPRNKDVYAVLEDIFDDIDKAFKDDVVKLSYFKACFDRIYNYKPIIALTEDDTRTTVFENETIVQSYFNRYPHLLETYFKKEQNTLFFDDLRVRIINIINGQNDNCVTIKNQCYQFLEQIDPIDSLPYLPPVTPYKIIIAAFPSGSKQDKEECDICGIYNILNPDGMDILQNRIFLEADENWDFKRIDKTSFYQKLHNFNSR